LHFSLKRQDVPVPNFFQDLEEKTCLFTTCIEKQCTQPLKG